MTGAADRTVRLRVALRLRAIMRGRPVLRREVVWLVGRLQAARDRGLSREARWQRRSSDELTYWRYALRDPETAAGFATRLDPNREVETTSLRTAISEIEANEITILDVGSGPLTSATGTYPSKELRVVAVDPLGHEYVALLAELGLRAPVRPISCGGEELVERFGSETFDIAFALNAVDHSVDPLAVLDNMLRVTKRSGRVALTHLRNEGEREGYMGIHVWNIDCIDGRFVIWNQDERHDVANALRAPLNIRCWTSENRVHCLISRR